MQMCGHQNKQNAGKDSGELLSAFRYPGPAQGGVQQIREWE